MNIPVYGQYMRNMGADLQMLKVTASTIPNMKVHVEEGNCIVNRKLVEYAGGTVGPIAVPTVDSYIVVIGLKGAVPVIIYGNSAENNPVVPDIPADTIPLAAIVLRYTDTCISQDMIQDIRPLFSTANTITDHNKLSGRDSEDAHTIASITGLQDELNTKLSEEEVKELLVDKANASGTRSTKFTLNANATGTPVSDIVLEFKRGNMPSAMIRFNEETDLLEFFDGDGKWHPFNTSIEIDPFNEEVYYTKAQVDTFIAELRRQVFLKSDSSRVTALEEQMASAVTIDYVDNRFQNIYSKQDIDRIAREMREAVLTVQNKVDRDEVYSKDEIDNKFAEVGSDIDDKIQELKDVVIEDLQPQIDSIETSVDNKIQELTNTVNTTVDNLSNAVNGKISEVDEKIEQQNETIDNNYNNFQRILVEKCGQLDAKIDIKVREADAKHDELTAAINDNTTAINTNTENITTNANDIAELKNKDIELNNFINDVKVELTNKIDTLEEKVDTNKDTTDTSISDLRTEITDGYQAADQLIYDKLEEEYVSINDQLVLKCNSDDVYTKPEIDDMFENIELDNYYTKAETDQLLNTKANINDVYQYTDLQIQTVANNKQDVLGFIPENSANKNVANGYAGLDGNGKISLANLPDVSKQATYVVATEAEKDALNNLISGMKAFVVENKKSYIFNGVQWLLTSDADWENVNIDFSNINNKPTDLTGYGITDAASSTDLMNGLATKAEKNHTHEVSEINTDANHMFISSDKLAAIDAKADAADVYSKDVADSKFVMTTTFDSMMSNYTTTADMNLALANKADATAVYVKSDVDSLLSDKANKSDVYTKAEVDQLINDAIANVLQQVQDQINNP